MLRKNVPVPPSISGPALCILNSLLTETYTRLYNMFLHLCSFYYVWPFTFRPAVFFLEWKNQALAVLVPILPANPAKRANPSFFTMSYGITSVILADCVHRGYCLECRRGPSRHPLSSAAAEGGKALICTIGKAYTAWPRRGCSTRIFWQFQLLVYSKCTQNTATGRGHYTSRLMLSLCVHCSRLRPKQTLVSLLLAR